MQLVDYLIIGGGIAGTTASDTIRKKDASARIVIVSDEPHPLYSRVMLSKPNFFLGKIPFDAVWMKKDAWYEENNITLMKGRSAVKLDHKNKSVVLDDGTVLKYGKLLLATGSKARRMRVKGVEKKGVHYLRTIDDAKGIIEGVKTAKRAVVVGAGFIGLEMCDMLNMAGLEVTAVVRGPYFWSSVLDEKSAHMMENAMKKSGVNMFLKSEIQEIAGGDAVEKVVLKDGTKIDCELIVIGVGTCLRDDWAKSSGVSCGRGIETNEYLETNLDDVWAAGDNAEFRDVILKERIRNGTWISAQMQGRIAGLNMTGARETFQLVSSYTAQGFGLHIAFIGDVMAGERKREVARGHASSGWHTRLILKDDKIIGGILINRKREISPVTKLIERNIDVGSCLEELADPEFDLSALLDT